MRQPMRLTSVAFGAGMLALLALPAAAQDAGSVRIQGTIEKHEGGTVVIAAKDGSHPSLALSSTTLIVANEPSRLDAVKPGDFVASAARKGADGKLHSTELRIFPEALRGLGEGQRPMDAPDTMMTNAAVSEVVAAPQGRVLEVRYKGGTAELVVGPEVPVTLLVVSDASVLRPGTRVFVTATKAADGAMAATRIFAN